MKKAIKKIADILKLVFGYGIMVTLFTGGFTFFGYIAALIIGGDAAIAICTVIYEKLFPIIIYASSCLILLGLFAMCLSGETALTASKDKKEKK